MSRTAPATRNVRVPGEPETQAQAEHAAADAPEAATEPAAEHVGKPFDPDAAAPAAEPTLADILARAEAAEQRAASAEKRAASAEAEAAALRATQPGAPAAARAEASKKNRQPLPNADTINPAAIKQPVQTAQGWIVPAVAPGLQGKAIA